jgi:hypothetical protein
MTVNKSPSVTTARVIVSCWTAADYAGHARVERGRQMQKQAL